MSEFSCSGLQFPSRHQYTWPRIECHPHPLSSAYLSSNMMCAEDVSSKAEGKSVEICRGICETRAKYEKGFLADGEWQWLNEHCRSGYLAALQAADASQLSQSLVSLFRQDASYGIVSGTYADFCDPQQNCDIVNGIFRDVDTWLDYVNKAPELYLSMPDVGMPYGVRFGESLVSPDICRHDYHAERIFQMTERIPNKTPTVLEIGGGYGGAAYQFLKRTTEKKSLWIIVDLFETLCVQYYWLISCGIKVEFSLDGDVKSSSSRVVLVPSDMAMNLDADINIVYNCNSFSEMAHSTVENYFNLINTKWKPKYIFHQNADVLLYPDSTRHVEFMGSDFPISTEYNLVYRTISPWAGGSGRYREFLYELNE